jgi:hypothetical protein
MMGDHPYSPSPSLKEDNATASSAAGGSKLSKDSLSLVEARHMSKNTRRNAVIAEQKKTPDVRRSPKRKRCNRETPQNKYLMKIRPRTEQQADLMFHDSGEEKKGNEGEQQQQQMNEEEEEEEVQ